MAVPTDHLDQLRQLLQGYDDRFIAKYIPANPEEGPDDWLLDVKAYCLLAHGAFEEYFESVSTHLMGQAERKWIYEKKLSVTLLMAVARYGLKCEIAAEDEAPETKIYDHVRRLAEEAKKRFSHDVDGNHGISPKYLRSLLTPVGIEFLPDPVLSSSLIQLARERGKYAHRGSVNKCISPEDAKNCVDDCLLLAVDVEAKALASGICD